MKFAPGIFLSIFILCGFGTVQAATLYIDPHETEIYPGDTLSLAVRINTDDGECINTIDGVITYPPSVLPVDIALGNSIFPVWVESPIIDKANNQITFAGGIPNGYCGRIEGDPRLTNVILELIFQAPGLQMANGETPEFADVTFTDQTAVLLNDGAGTPATLSTLGARFQVHNTPREQVVDEWNNRIANDVTPPGEFSISLNSEPSAFGGRYFIVFNTTDKQSGIDHYEVIEEPFDQVDVFNWGASDAPWVVAKSPYLLTDQSLNSTIRVRAIDKAGNEYIASLVPDEEMRALTHRALFYIVGGIFVLLVSIGAFLLYRRKIRMYDTAMDEPDMDMQSEVNDIHHEK